MLNHKIGCLQCGLILEIDNLKPGEKANCPRCHETLTRNVENLVEKVIAFTITGIVILLLTLFYPFMSIDFKGMIHEIHIIDTVSQLANFDFSYIAIFLFFTVIGLPALFLYLSLSIFLSIKKNNVYWYHRYFMRLYFLIQPWLMVDVFLIAVLVSFAKIGHFSHISLHIGFFAFFAETLVLMKLLSLIDKENTWRYFESATDAIKQENASYSSAICKTCHAINAEKNTSCWRCKSSLHALHEKNILIKSWAFLITALILYLPANILPMMITKNIGETTTSTILAGVALLWDMGSYVIAIIILIASIIIPITKILILIILYSQTSLLKTTSEKTRLTQIDWFRFTHIIGRWSFIDIFVISIIVALVQLNNIVSIVPGAAALSFTGVVMLTILSTMAFDTRLLWQSSDTIDEVQVIND